MSCICLYCFNDSQFSVCVGCFSPVTKPKKLVFLSDNMKNQSSIKIKGLEMLKNIYKDALSILDFLDCCDIRHERHVSGYVYHTQAHSHSQDLLMAVL